MEGPNLVRRAAERALVPPCGDIMPPLPQAVGTVADVRK
jgi:hypothetical protein